MIRSFFLAIALSACATSTQSARTLPVGKTEVTVQINRSDSDDSDNSAWGGELMVRHGFVERFDLGLHLSRTPGFGDAVSAIAVDPKAQLTAVDAPTSVSIGAPIGVVFQERDDDFHREGLVVVPTLYVGQHVSPTMELVIAPKLYVAIPRAKSGEDELYFGGSLGVRFTDPHHHWALHPELGFTRLTSNNESEIVVTLGLGVAVGN